MLFTCRREVRCQPGCRLTAASAARTHGARDGGGAPCVAHRSAREGLAGPRRVIRLHHVAPAAPSPTSLPQFWPACSARVRCFLRVGVALGQGLERSFARVARGVRRQRVEVDKAPSVHHNSPRQRGWQKRADKFVQAQAGTKHRRRRMRRRRMQRSAKKNSEEATPLTVSDLL